MNKKLKEVLIIDDDMTANFLNERIVNDLQLTHQVTILKNGREALEYILSRGNSSEFTYPELIILDHYMPIMDGLELMETLNKTGTIKLMRSIFFLLAVQTNKDDLKKFSELGVQEYTTKPLSRKRLLDAVNKYWSDDTARNNSN